MDLLGSAIPGDVDKAYIEGKKGEAENMGKYSIPVELILQVLMSMEILASVLEHFKFNDACLVLRNSTDFVCMLHTLQYAENKYNIDSFCLNANSGVIRWFGGGTMLGGGPAERRASGGGPTECRASNGGPAERRALGGGPAERIKRENRDRSCLLAPRPPPEFCRTNAGPPPNAGVSPDHHLRPDVLPDHHLRPDVLPDHHLRPDVLSDHHLRPDVLPDNHRRPYVLPNHHLRPDVLPDNHRRPDVLLDHHLRPDVLPDHHLTPDILPDHHLMSDVLPNHCLHHTSVEPPPDAGVLRDYQLTPEHPSDAKVLPDHQVTPGLTLDYNQTNAAGEGTSGPSLEDRIRKMEESQNEIFQLLREPRRPALEPQEEIHLPRESMLTEDVRSEHLHVEVPFPPPRRRPQTHQDNELADTARSTHPSQAGGDLTFFLGPILLSYEVCFSRMAPASVK
ncbi:hypothetical protein M5K25_005648 [Dendrobium thyrsiflorum]|uniref:Uncharacterized protein n=1 Tax=Dendrobium thyrsiflorum TaxID=117978 RepID=A0ABD0VIF6_DENTH